HIVHHLVGIALVYFRRLRALVGHGYRSVARALVLGAEAGALGREGHKTHEAQLVAVALPLRSPLRVLLGGVCLGNPIGPFVQLRQPILTKRRDLVAGHEQDANLLLGAFKRDQGVLALRLVGRAGLATASTFTRL